MADTSATRSSAIDPTILNQAADWLVLLQSGEATEQDLTKLSQWRQQSAAHEAAWRRAESVLSSFRQVPAQVGQDTLARLPRHNRRKLLGLLAIAAPTGWLLWHYRHGLQRADYQTATGEQQTIELADGSQLVLNTRTRVDIAFTQTQRTITLLAGEIMLTTGKDAARPAGQSPRPLMVRTEHGSLQPIGTRFAVRHFDNYTQVSVLEGAVQARPAQSSQTTTVPAGQQLRFTTTELHTPQAADATSSLWTNGMLLAQDMRLGDLIAELARYQRGLLRCDPEVAQLLVSGSFPVNDIAASLRVLEKSLPVRIARPAPYWITVKAR